jgi:hypothetical protein
LGHPERSVASPAARARSDALGKIVASVIVIKIGVKKVRKRNKRDWGENNIPIATRIPRKEMDMLLMRGCRRT